MSLRIPLTTGALGLALTLSLSAQPDTVPGGTEITVRTIDRIDARDAANGRIYRGTVDRDIRDRDGRVAIPRGSDAELTVRQTGSNNVVLDLESINANGRRYMVSSSAETAATEGGKEGVGANRRTGKYVGGGAVVGAIIGAIAGGGKGAAIGAASGAGAGAIGETVTRGRNVHVPPETLLTFRLERPVTVGGPDTGYMRNGNHYHRYDDYRGEADRDRNYDRNRDRNNNPDR